MSPSDISISRLVNQQVTSHTIRTPKQLVAWMGALQAQNFSMAQWAIGVRVPSATRQTILSDIDKGALIRTHVLRPTWHLVSADDVEWMLDLTAPHILASLKRRTRELDLTPRILNKSLNIFEKALSGGRHLTREEMMAALKSNRIATQEQRGVYILLYAELLKCICSGAMQGKKTTYALFAERVKQKTKLDREEAIVRLMTTYFKSHGPATLDDFNWWSGLPVADSRRAMEIAGKNLIGEPIAGHVYWYANAYAAKKAKRSAHLLPAFDEFIIGYKDRSACLSAENRAATISINGIFWPVLVVNGQVTGLWKQTPVKSAIKVEITPFANGDRADNKAVKKMINDAAARVIDFFGSGNKTAL